jgi:hypothetical protein
MKTNFLIVSFLLINLHFLNARENITTIKNGKIGITYSSFGQNNVYRNIDLLNSESYHSDYFRTLGINYVYPLNKWLEAETGVEYSRHNIKVGPNFPPTIDVFPLKEKFSLINIPVSLRANFFNYFFVNGGLFLDVDASVNSPIDNQIGIGFLLGLAIKYDFDIGFSAFVNPYSKIHSLIPFQAEQSIYHQRIWENGVRIGITYDLGKMK